MFASVLPTVTRAVMNVYIYTDVLDGHRYSEEIFACRWQTMFSVRDKTRGDRRTVEMRV